MARTKHVEVAQQAQKTRADSSVSGDTKIAEAGDTRLKYNFDGVELVPQPSDDPRDPLNWPVAKKVTIFSLMCFGTFVGIASAVANVLATPVQAKDWGVTPEEASYTVSAVLGGIVVGPVILCAAVRVFGVMSCCFWSEVAVVATSIWSAVSAGPGNYNSFIASRVVAGLFTGTVQVFTTGVIAQIFFLHQRGKVLAIYSTVYMVATVAGPTFSGFIVQYVEWPVCFWWTVGANGLSAILFLLFGDDTSWDRQNNKFPAAKDPPSSWAGKRMALFCPGTRVVAPGKVQKIKTSYNVLFRIAVSPVCILVGLYGLISYAWFIMAGVQIPIILAEPPSQDGFGFSSLATGYFYFSAWVGALIGVGYGILVNDRLPLLLQKKKGGIWHPEYRLHATWFPSLIVAPIGIGLFGAAVFYHLPYMVLAVAEAMIVFGATATISPAVNYVIEIFKSHPQEVGTALNVYRIAFSVSIQFFYTGWVAAVGVNWAWGTAAFLSLVACAIIIVLIWKGAVIRKYSLLEDEAVAEENETENQAEPDVTKSLGREATIFHPISSSPKA